MPLVAPVFTLLLAAASFGDRRLSYELEGNQVGFTQPDTSAGPAARRAIADITVLGGSVVV